jgi:hypothetical protein
VAADVEVAPDQVDAVAVKILDAAMERVNAVLVARGGGLRRAEAPPAPAPAAVARRVLGERQGAAIGRQRGQERQQQAVQVEQLAQGIFQGSAPMTGVQFTPDQARAAAAQAVHMTSKGADAGAATVAAMENVLAAMQQLGRRLDGIEMRADAAGARAQQVGRQQAKMRWQAPPPWNTIGGG